MDLKRLRTFVAVAELGGVSAAAARLRLTQPALSRQLQDLQREFGVRLFERVGRRLLPTGEGEELLADCRGLLSQAEAVAERARSLAQGAGGALRVGASPQMIESVFPSFLRRYAVRRPDVRVQLVEAGAVAQVAMLERGETHLAIGLEPEEEGRFARHRLPPFQMLVAHAPAFRIGGGDVELRRLADAPLLLLDQSFGSRKLFDAACRLARFAPDVYLESRAAHTLLALAEAGFGAAIVPSTVRIDRRRLRVARVTFRGRALEAPLAVLWDSRRALPRYAEDFPAALAAHMQEVLPASRPKNEANRS